MLLVTGITGHSGSYFLKELIANDYTGKIRCVIRNSSDTSLIEKSGLDIELVFGDLNNELFIKNVMEDVETIFHIYNINHSSSIVKYAIESKVKKIILVHTTGIYSKFKEASKQYIKIENDVLERIENANYKIDLTILRPTMIYGDIEDKNISKFIKMVDYLPIIPIIDKGKSVIQPVNARDLGKVFYSVLSLTTYKGIKTYTLSGEKPISLYEVLVLIRKELNTTTYFINIPLKLGVLIAKILKALSLNKIDYVEKVERMGEDRSYLHNKAFKELKYSPMSFEKGIKIEVAEYLEKRGSR